MSDEDENVEFNMSRAYGQVIPGGGQREFLLSLKIKSRLASLSSSSKRKHEPYVLADPIFQTSIIDARKILGIQPNIRVDEDDIEKWIVFVMTSKTNLRKSGGQYRDAISRFSEVVSSVLDNCNLPTSWDYYVSVYLLKGIPPQYTAFDIEEVEIIGVTENNVSINFKKGISKTQFNEIGKIITEHLGEPSLSQITSSQSKRNTEIYLKKQNGASYKNLATEYFPRQAERDLVQVIDKVKKIVRRERHNYTAGTKLVK